jgi:two-component system, LytTR family, response regulator
MTPLRIRTVLIDDEVLARLALRQALATHEEVEIVAECGNADEAMQVACTLKPDLLFVDIQMPGMDGFELLQELSPQRLPLVVFATAYAEHALRAFDAGALDYVLKPIDQGRFNQAMSRVKEHWYALSAVDGNVEHAMTVEDSGAYAQRISVRKGEHIQVIAADDIEWIQADGNYVNIHACGVTHLHRESLSRLLESLDPARFLRIHRSTVVNVERIHEVHPLYKGNAEIVLRDGRRFVLSRRFRAPVRRLLGLP